MLCGQRPSLTISSVTDPFAKKRAAGFVPAALSKLQRDAAATKLGSVDYRECSAGNPSSQKRAERHPES